MSALRKEALRNELIFNEKSWNFSDNSSTNNNIYDHDRRQNILLDANHNRIISISSNLEPHLHIVSQLPYSYDRRRIQIQGCTNDEFPNNKSKKIVSSPAPSSTNNNNCSPAADFVGSRAANFFSAQKSPISGTNFGISTSHSPVSFSKLDRQIQTSPSTLGVNKLSVQGAGGTAQGSSLHGNNPRRQRYARTEVESPTHQGTVKQQPLSQTKISSKSELSHWVATRPGCRLARAKYNYKPLRDSPNDNPELELCLQPGDYVILFGEMDEDYFYRGELYNGQQGLVPSNYIEIVPEDELAISVSRIKSSMRALPKPQDNHPSSKMQNKGSKDNSGGMDSTKFRRTATTSILSGLQTLSNIAQLSRRGSLTSLTLPDSSCPYPSVDVSGVSVFEVRQPDGVRVPCPRDLLVERQLAKSILISWSPPQNPLIPVTHYHVCVDGTVKSVIPGSSKTKALIEDVDCLKEHRISVRAVTDHGHSADPSCTVTVGKDANVAPQDLKAFNLTPVSCQISWYPSNSSCEHIMLLNGLKVGSCPAGVCQIRMNGLIPSTMYRCSVRVKEPKAVLEEKPVENWVDFKTLPKIGLPDPPSNVQCELGPQDGTLLVTWTPVKNQPKPPSRAAVIGYLIYADGRKITEIDSPTGDHVVLRCADLADDPPLFLTVKAKTREGAVSADSNVVRVPRIDGHGMPASTVDVAKIMSATSSLPRNVTIATTLAASAPTFQLLSSHAGQPSCSATSATGGLLMIQPQVAGTAANSGSAPQSFTSGNVPPNAITPAGAFVATGATTAAPSYAFVPAESLRSSAARLPQSAPTAGAQPQASSYYVFHPHLSQQHALGDLALPANAILVDKQQATPASLAEMENNYLLRHQQRQMNAAMAAGTNLNRAAIAAGLAPFGSDVQSPLGLWQHQRQQRYPVYQMPNQSLNYSRDRRSLPIGYSDAEFELNQQMPPPSTRPLMARYKKKLMQIDNRALSEPDLRLDPRTLPQALRGKRIRPRYVVALYDYNPRHMSPNPNGARDELSFHKGQVILAFTEKDADGFYYGELNGRYGLIPSNLVVETDREGQSVLVVQQRLADLSLDDQDFDCYASQPLPGRYGPYDQRDFDQRSGQQYSANLPRDHRLPRYRPTAVTDLERWSNYSDPLLTRNRYPDYEFDPTTSQPKSNMPDRVAVSYDEYPQHRDSDHALRRSVFKKKSHSLDYEDEPSSVAQAGNGRMVDQRGRYYPVSSRMRSMERRDRDKEDYYDQYPPNYPSTSDFVDRDGHGSERSRRHLPTASSSQDYYNNGGSIYRSTAKYDARNNRPDQDDDYPPPEINYANEYPTDVYRQDEKALSSRDGRHRYEEPYSSTGPPRNRDIRDGRYASASYEDNLYPDQYSSDRERDSTAYFGRKLPLNREEDRDFRRSRRNAPREHPQQTSGLHKSTGPTPGSTAGSSYHYAGGGAAPRRVIAKFDYDPKENSPNPGAEQEELTFRAGDVITIFGDVDDDGFFMGELNGRRGLVPSNFLSIDQSESGQMPQVQGGSGGGSFEQQSLDYSTMGAAPQAQQGRSRRDREAVSFANEDAVSRTATTDYTNVNGRSQPGSKAAANAGLVGRQTNAASSSGGRNVAPGASSMSTGKVGGGASTGQISKKMDSTIGAKTPPKKSSGPAPGGGGASNSAAQQRKQLPPVKNSAASGGRV